MPLPAALLARLKKRGLMKEDKDAENEEILAENYEDDGKRGEPEAEECEDKIIGNHLVYHAARCPNLENPYHDCVELCFKRYGRKPFRPHLASLRLRDRMLRRFPLPPAWIEVGDPDTGRFYYWNTTTDEVAWLTPQHPRSKAGPPAEKLRRPRYEEAVKRAEKEKEREKDKEKEERRRRESDRSDRRRSDRDRSGRRRRSPGGSASGESSGESSGSEGERAPRGRQDHRRRSQPSYSSRRDRDRDSDRRDRRERSSRKTNELDPMDPASYSDVPRGSWNTGLGSKDEAKTGVDTTASGPLFQQRPYPSPGDILRANAARKEKARESD